MEGSELEWANPNVAANQLFLHYATSGVRSYNLQVCVKGSYSQ